MGKQSANTKVTSSLGSASPKVLRNELNELQSLSDIVGDFIRYWGFRRIHGQIWTQIFLSKKSLSGAELTDRLGVSKALISPALIQLEEYGLIEMKLEGKKTKRYTAVPDVLGVIKKILLERESKIIDVASERHAKLSSAHDKCGSGDTHLDEAKLRELGEMILLAKFALGFIIGQSDDAGISFWAGQAQTQTLTQVQTKNKS